MLPPFLELKRQGSCWTVYSDVQSVTGLDVRVVLDVYAHRGSFSDRYLVGLTDGRLDAAVTGPIARCKYVINCAQSMH